MENISVFSNTNVIYVLLSSAGVEDRVLYFEHALESTGNHH